MVVQLITHPQWHLHRFDSDGGCSLKHKTMTISTLSQSAIESLIGKTIIDAKDNWIKLDNGAVIYLDESEVEALN